MNAIVDLNKKLDNSFAKILNTDEGKAWVEEMGAELEEIRQRVMDDLGERDIEYMRKVMKWQKRLEIGGRASLFLGFLPPFWLAGAGMLSVAKILENMEIGHNLMHGQFNWSRDEKMHSDTYEWDNVIPADHWKYTHNFEHHTYTNIVGIDHDVGYGLLRMDDSQKWDPRFLFQPISSIALLAFFQHFVSVHYFKLDKLIEGSLSEEEKAIHKKEWPKVKRKQLKQLAKDYLLFPLLAGPFFLFVLTGNITANLIRNVWAALVIFCGHFPKDVETFHASVIENETKGQWYVRQIKGSANISGGKLLHLMTGNLSHQIEHHLFPDMPANRYKEVAAEVQAICKKYGVDYETGTMTTQLKSVYKRIFDKSLPPKETKNKIGKFINKFRKFEDA